MLALITRKRMYLLAGIVALILFTGFLYKIYIPRVTAFGCFDDCNNFMGGYFLLHGKKLFSEIFFNHAPGMAYISEGIQYFSRPINLYELILRHRQFIILFGFFGNLLLLVRFGWKIVGFIVIYELSKFYLFGDRFLAEALVVYLLVYLGGLAWDILKQKSLTFFDYILSAVFVWFVIFTREPYIPLALFLYVFLLMSREKSREKIIATSILLVLSCLTLIYHNIPDLVFNVFTVNITNIQIENNSSHVFGTGIFQSFFYPFWVIVAGGHTYFGILLLVMSILFILESGWYIYTRQYKIVLFVWFTLGLANLRFIPPGTEFYQAFHMLVWYGIFLFFSFSFVADVHRIKLYQYIFLCSYGFVILSLLTSHQSFVREHIDQQTEYITNYGIPLQVGNVVGVLSKPNDTLFLDGFDDIIYWVSQRHSSYPYSWYTSLMPGISMYKNARLTMFRKDPPDFYYGDCKQEKNPEGLPNFIKSQYVRLNNSGKPSCLWVKETKLSSITSQQWESAEQLLYTLPQTVKR